MSRLSDVNAFINQSRTCRTADDLRRMMESITREMSFQSYALFQHVKHFSWTDKKLLAISNYSKGWLEYFFDNKFTKDDPVLMASHRTSVGFRFGEIPNLIRLSERQHEILAATRREGITDGFCVPSHIPGETNGTCTFIVRDARPLPETNLPMAQLVGSFAYEAGRRIQLAGVSIVNAPGKKLTTRQLECIVLIARGKTDWEIAKILGLHEQTVTDHVNAARTRCGVSRRTELVVHALYNGDLTFNDILN
jgi:LuxR family transcriptional regulator, quorum-sensing system regulator CciR